MTYQAADRLDPPMVEVLEDDQWWDGTVQAQELRDGVWWGNVVYRREGNHAGWFPADQVRPDETDYSRGRTDAAQIYGFREPARVRRPASSLTTPSRGSGRSSTTSSTSRQPGGVPRARASAAALARTPSWPSGVQQSGVRRPE